MGKAYSMDSREAVARAYDECGSSLGVAEQVGCSASWVRRLIQGRRDRGTLAPVDRKPPDRRGYGDADERRIRELIRGRPDATLAEGVAAIGKPVHPAAASRALARLGLPRKQRRRTPASRAGPT
jgi:transposase